MSNHVLAKIVRALIALPVLCLATLLFSQASASSDDTYDARLEQAIRLYGDKQFVDAGMLLAGLANSQPGRKEAFFWLGRTRAQQGDWAASREAFKRYIELAPSDPEGPLGVARAFRKENKPAEAELWFRKALELDPANQALRREMEEGVVATTPRVETPAASSPETTSDQGDEGFWHQGIAGICGARKVWWGWLLAIIIYAICFFSGAVTTGGHARGWADSSGQPDSAGAIAFMSSLFGASVWYILFWGVPGGVLVWILMAFLSLVSAGMASGVAAAAR